MIGVLSSFESENSPKESSNALEKWNVKVYYTGRLASLPAVIPKDKLVQTKKETHRISETIVGCVIGSDALSIIVFKE